MSETPFSLKDKSTWQKQFSDLRNKHDYKPRDIAKLYGINVSRVYYLKRKEKESIAQKEARAANSKKSFQKRKAAMKEYRDRFGAKCSVCDYNKVQSALQFHHKNPEDKKEKIAVWAGYDKHKDSIEEELKKCILVCSNCHTGIHSGEILLPD